MEHYEEVLKLLHDKFDWKLTDSLTKTGKKLVADTIKALKIAENTQALQLQQTGVIDSCSNAYIGKEFVYTSRITNCKTIFKVARTDDRYGQTILISENKNRYFLSDVIPHN